MNTYPVYAERAADESEYLATRAWIGRQSAEYEALVQMKDSRLRVTISFDSYDDQSSAKVERWDGESWHRVVSCTGAVLHGRYAARAETPPNPYQLAPLTEESFGVTPHALLCEAATVIA